MEFLCLAAGRSFISVRHRDEAPENVQSHPPDCREKSDPSQRKSSSFEQLHVHGVV